MIKVTILTNFDGSSLEDLTNQTALEALRDEIKKSLTPFATAIEKEGGSVTVWISSPQKIKVDYEGISDKLQKSIDTSLTK